MLHLIMSVLLLAAQERTPEQRMEALLTALDGHQAAEGYALAARHSARTETPRRQEFTFETAQGATYRLVAACEDGCKALGTVVRGEARGYLDSEVAERTFVQTEFTGDGKPATLRLTATCDFASCLTGYVLYRKP